MVIPGTLMAAILRVFVGLHQLLPYLYELSIRGIYQDATD